MSDEQPSAEVRRLRAAIWALIDAFDGCVADFESRGKGGQHVSPRSEFGSMPPSSASAMRRWARDLRGALTGEWPMLREEFQKAYGVADSAALDEMFKERTP